MRGAVTHRALLYWHTLRYLRPVQLGARLRAALYRPAPRSRAAPARRQASGAWQAPARRVPSMTAPMTFRFLNETLEVGADGWGREAQSQLWRYNLHYFDDLNSVDAAARRAWHAAAVASWVANNPPRSEGWSPYPTSLRVVNWIKWALGGGELDARALESLARQVRALTGRIEYHLLGNHLLANAKALVFAGVFFEGPEADAWRAQGMAILERELPEQVLADGGHFERSPMYHALALEDVLDLVNAATAYAALQPAAASWRARARQMRAWLRAMCHPDGEIAFFNDAALGVAPSPAELERYAREVLGDGEAPAGVGDAIRVTDLSASGYVRAEAPDAVLLIDVAPVGPDYQPGHAHADTLSFELSLFGQRVVVNGGTSRYGTGSEREAERGTAAHSTVTIDDADSSEVWAGFRVARRARPFDLEVKAEPMRLRVSCSHDGYRRLAGRPIHRRTWQLEPGLLRVEDHVAGGFTSAIARFHLHPAVGVEPDESAASGVLRLPGGRALRWRVVAGAAKVEPGVYCPEFGRRLASHCLAVRVDAGARASVELSW